MFWNLYKEYVYCFFNVKMNIKNFQDGKKIQKKWGSWHFIRKVFWLSRQRRLIIYNWFNSCWEVIFIIFSFCHFLGNYRLPPSLNSFPYSFSFLLYSFIILWQLLIKTCFYNFTFLCNSRPILEKKMSLYRESKYLSQAVT